MRLEKIFFYSLCLTIFSFSYGQSKFVINDHSFTFEKEMVNNEQEKEIVNLFRNSKKILSHTIYESDGDCSSGTLKLGGYIRKSNEIIFYSYWAIYDRLPTLMMPYGFRKQVYQVDENGVVRLKESSIYIEDFIEGNSNFYEENKWKHKGLDYLHKKPKTTFEKQAFNDYIDKISKKYSAKFVLGIPKKQLEQEVRKYLKNEIKLHTSDWVEGEVYGKVRK